ncbi:MAG TPA: DUF3394 domain-containing protein, partial [Gammaproteobacteria bacterium]|nr:DUF3394 domain-containing protein [Gammaproteobacteria bacterium]
DMIVAPYEEAAPERMEEAAGKVPPGEQLRLRIAGEDAVGNPREFVALLSLGEGASGKERLASAGVELAEIDGKIVVDNVAFGSQAEKAGLAFDQVILTVRIPSNQPAKEWMWIPALLVLGLIAFMQTRRREPRASAPATA